VEIVSVQGHRAQSQAWAAQGCLVGKASIDLFVDDVEGWEEKSQPALACY